MRTIKMIAAGAVGSVAGSFLWVALFFVTISGVGWFAWVFGLLVGSCVRWGAGDTRGVRAGIIAMVMTAIPIVAGKFILSYVAVAKMLIPDEPATANSLVGQLGLQIARERESQGQKIAWPSDLNDEYRRTPEDFPPDIWEAAYRQWSALSSEEQARKIDERQKEGDALYTKQQRRLRRELIAELLGPLDFLWLTLGSATAFMVGKGFGRKRPVSGSLTDPT